MKNKFLFSNDDRTITAYTYQADTREYIAQCDCFIPASTGLPAYCTHIKPPEAAQGSVAVFDEKKQQWDIVDDFRGMTVFDTRSRQSGVVMMLGPLSGDVTPLAPLGEFDRWNGEAWVEDADAKRQHIISLNETERRRRIAEANQKISIITDRIDLGMTKDVPAAEKSLLAWRAYRIEIDGVVTGGELVELWPAMPEV
ncbi:MAG: tail fiber assembly protein [Hafnia sp.]|uniref:tail fiber assembly protein n=1 Tax=Hafnia sp. TaxID=1873498 RepID=UPI002FCC7842